MKIKHKPVEDRDIYDDISTQPKGSVRYIFELYRTTEEMPIDPKQKQNINRKQSAAVEMDEKDKKKDKKKN